MSKEKVKKLEKMQISFHSGFSCICIYKMLYACKNILAHQISLEILFRSSLPSLMEKTQKTKFSRLTCMKGRCVAMQLEASILLQRHQPGLKLALFIQILVTGDNERKPHIRATDGPAAAVGAFSVADR